MNRSDNWKDVPRWLRTITIVAILNFASFFVIALMNGGDAVNGREEGGKYYVANHGRYTEVSKTFFEYSRIHVYSVFITLPPALIGGIWYTARARRK